jgi:hypothetical protein
MYEGDAAGPIAGTAACVVRVVSRDPTSLLEKPLDFEIKPAAATASQICAGAALRDPTRVVGYGGRRSFARAAAVAQFSFCTARRASSPERFACELRPGTSCECKVLVTRLVLGTRDREEFSSWNWLPT